MSRNAQIASAYSLARKTQRPHAQALEAARQQHAERLMREPALERIADQIFLRTARKGLDEKLAGLGNERAPFLDAQPFVHRIGQHVPGFRLRHHLAHALRQERRERELAAIVGRHLRLRVARASHISGVLVDAFEAQHGP